MNGFRTHFLDVKDDRASVLEIEDRRTAYRTVWNTDVKMKTGDTVTVFSWRARDGTNWAHAREVTFAGGRKLFIGPPAGTGDGGTTPAVEVR